MWTETTVDGFSAATTSDPDEIADFFSKSKSDEPD